MVKKKRMKKIVTVMLPAFAAVALAACGSGNTSTSDASDQAKNASSTEQTKSDASADKEAVTGYMTPDVENGEIVIDTDTLTDHPLYVNYDSNGTTIQMIAVNASDGSARLSLNTCQACNPSPMAYFEEKDGVLVCQNCGNMFTMDSVGEASGGCNPMNIEYEVTDNKLVVKTADLDSYADKFTSWSGPVEE